MPWLADKIAEVVAVKGHRPKTAQTYTHWARAMFRFCGERDPRTWTAADVKAFLTHLATARPPFSAKSQRPARESHGGARTHREGAA